MQEEGVRLVLEEMRSLSNDIKRAVECVGGEFQCLPRVRRAPVVAGASVNPRPLCERACLPPSLRSEHFDPSDTSVMTALVFRDQSVARNKRYLLAYL